MTDLLPEPLRPYQGLIVGAVTAIVIFFIGWIASKWVHRLVLRLTRRSKLDEALGRFLAALAQYATLAVAVIAALGKVGVQTTSLVALLGAAGLAVGLALQGNLSHFASGVMLLLFRPFTLEDRVTVGGNTGVVKDIGLFATTMRTPANETIIMPNGAITSKAIVNHTALGTLRLGVGMGVAYGTPLEKAMRVMLESARSVEGVLEEPAPAVVLSGFGASSIDFEVRPWCAATDAAAVTHAVRVALHDALEAEGIEIPFDQIVVHQAS